MAVENTRDAAPGWQAPLFGLRNVDGRILTLDDVAGETGTVVAFICNHCPYVVAVIDRLVRDFAEMQGDGIGTVAICSNDAKASPADSYEKMVAFAADHGFGFPYLHDADQSAARAYGAVCTPDFFGFDATLRLRYRGRLDAGRPGAPAPGRRELLDAMRLIAATGEGPTDQHPSMGCSIKWAA